MSLHSDRPGTGWNSEGWLDEVGNSAVDDRETYDHGLWLDSDDHVPVDSHTNVRTGSYVRSMEPAVDHAAGLVSLTTPSS